MDQTKLFTKGMNKDLDYKMSQEEVYLDAHNIVILNDAGGTSMSLNNIKGNLLNGGIPDTPRLQKVTITGGDGGTTLSTLTISGPFGSETGTPWDTTNKTYKDLYDYINTDSAYANLHTVYEVYYGDNYLVVMSLIYPTTVLNDITSTNFLNSYPKYVDAQENLKIIGSTNIRDDIYLFTTNSEDEKPSGTVGQIWKYTYDKINLTSTIELKYNNYIDFSTYWCIAPTAALGRYENSQIQRVYWTDNYNKLRTLNVANPQSLAIDVSILDIAPSVDFDIPILTDMIALTGPTILSGAYQCAYRLKNTAGAVTTFSELSNLVFVGSGIEQNNTNGLNFKDYVGAPQGTPQGKHITWTINNIDRDFDRIEICIAFKDTLNGTPTFFLLNDDSITDDVYSFTYSGELDTTTITLNEFLALSGIFTHCKTIATKDNRLFVANIKTQLGDIDWDARAYRWESGNTYALVNNNTLTTGLTSSNYNDFDQEQDTINPSLLSVSDPNYLSGYQYKSDGITLGGEGVNISYEFVTIASKCDVMNSSSGNFSPPYSYGSPWRFTNQVSNLTDLTLGVKSTTNNGAYQEQDYPVIFGGSKMNDGLKYPQCSSLLKGFERNEIYRFGIQFYDKSKNPYFVKWIGDIKMPDYSDNNLNCFYEDLTAVDPGDCSDFRLSFAVHSISTAYVNSLGVNFNITGLESISNKIDGYSIVRVKRTNNDKTIIASGLIFPALTGTPDGQFYPTSLANQRSGNSAGAFALEKKYFYFVTPNILDGSQIGPQTGMNVNIKSLTSNANYNTDLSTGGAQPYYYFKNYNITYPYSPIFTISDLYNLSFGDQQTITGGNTVNNFDFDVLAPNTGLSNSFGNQAYFIYIGGGSISYGTLTANGKFFATITRTLPSQYGGNTYTARSKNEYISCTNYRSIKTTSIIFTDNFYTYNGDVFVNLYDSCRWAKNTSDTSAPVTRPSTGSAYSATFFFAVESSINTDLRHAYYMNKNFSGGSGYETEFVEQYLYNAVYSSENDIRTYFPKPDPFILNEEFDNRFYASNIKINGELIDSWGLFKETNYWDVEGTYGPINAISILQDKLYFWQNRAFGLMEVNPRAVVLDANNTSNPDLQLSTGLPLQRHDYISTEVGLQHQWGTTKSSYKLFWMDVANKKFFSYSPGQQINPESDIKGMFSYFNNNLNDNILKYDKPTYFTGIGIRAVYDFKYNQAIFTFIDGDSKEIINQYTLAFNEFINSFTSFYDFTPLIYFTDGYKIFTTDNYNQADSALSNIYIHDSGDYNNFYSTVFPSTIKFVFNKDPLNTKTFDNIKYDSQAINTNNENKNDKTWTSIRLYNDYQNTDYQSLVLDTNIKRKERTFKLAIPRNRVLYTSSNSPNIITDLSPTEIRFANRMRDKYIVVDMTFDNPDNLLLTTNNISCEMRESAR